MEETITNPNTLNVILSVVVAILGGLKLSDLYAHFFKHKSHQSDCQRLLERLATAFKIYTAVEVIEDDSPRHEARLIIKEILDEIKSTGQNK